jgi:general secretion pathway protein G
MTMLASTRSSRTDRIHRADRPDRARPARRSVRRAARRGFTLLEIIVVVTIIGLLAAVVAPRLLGNIGKAKTSIAQREVSQLAQQIQIWMADQGMSRLPDDFDLAILAEGDERTLNADDLLDPWERSYIVVIPGEKNPDFDVISYGADGEPGGEGEDADVVS